MKKISLSSKKIITWVFVNHAMFILLFLTLGFLTTTYKAAVIINFILDVVLCLVSLILNFILFSKRYAFPVLGKIGLLLITLFFIGFTYFAFLMPENGLPPALFA